MPDAATSSKDWTDAEWESFLIEARTFAAFNRLAHDELRGAFKVLQDRGYVITKAE